MSEQRTPDLDPFSCTLLRVPTTVLSTHGTSLAIYEVHTAAGSSGNVAEGRGGVGADRTVLLVHAAGLHARAYAPLAGALLRAGLRPVAVDLYGHGDSQPSTSEGEGPSWEAYSRDLGAVVETLGLAGCFAFGHSLGGHVALRAEQARPGTFRGIYAFEPVVPPDAGPMREMHATSGAVLSKRARSRRATFQSYSDAMTAYGSRPPLSSLHPAALEGYVRGGFREEGPARAHPPAPPAVRIKCAPEFEAQLYLMEDFERCYSKLSQVSCPVVVAVGNAEAPGVAWYGPGIVSQVQRGRLEAHPQLQHFGPLEDPLLVASRLQAFLVGESGMPATGRSKL